MGGVEDQAQLFAWLCLDRRRNVAEDLDRSVAGRVAIVTGAASGMGRATAHLFADEGARVVVADLGAERVQAVVDEITAAHGDGAAIGVTCDVSDPTALDRLVEKTVAAFGGKIASAPPLQLRVSKLASPLARLL